MLLPMLIILSLLIVVVTFGFGFVVNMLAKRWWVGIAGYVLCWITVLYRTGFGLDRLQWFLFCLGFLGSFVASLGFRTLQRKGYRMFQRGVYTQSKS